MAPKEGGTAATCRFARRDQELKCRYYADGWLCEVEDVATGWRAQYRCDAAGHRTLERHGESGTGTVEQEARYDDDNQRQLMRALGFNTAVE